MITLDEAIKHCKEVAEQNETQANKWQEEGGEEWGKVTACRECAREHKQLAEWLKELKQFKEQEPCEDAISREALFDMCKKEIDHISKNWQNYHSPSEAKSGFAYIATNIYDLPSVTPQPKIGWNNHQIACMLADLFGDACACNYNGIDEWLSELCDFKDTCCPNTVGVACWEQFLKYSQSRYTESEVRE